MVSAKGSEGCILDCLECGQSMYTDAKRLDSVGPLHDKCMQKMGDRAMSDRDKFICTLDEYKRIIGDWGRHSATVIKLKRFDPTLYAPFNHFPEQVKKTNGHLLWMIEEMRAMDFSTNGAKCMRWLCFVQGVLWHDGEITIDAAIETNRAILADPPTQRIFGELADDE